VPRPKQQNDLEEEILQMRYTHLEAQKALRQLDKEGVTRDMILWRDSDNIRFLREMAEHDPRPLIEVARDHVAGFEVL
jgi:hypothetical protein